MVREGRKARHRRCSFYASPKTACVSTHIGDSADTISERKDLYCNHMHASIKEGRTTALPIPSKLRNHGRDVDLEGE